MCGSLAMVAPCREGFDAHGSIVCGSAMVAPSQPDERVFKPEEAAFYNHYNNRDIDRYHWSSEKFLSLWRTKFSVLMARERGRIGADAALGDIPKRLWAHAFDEMDDGPAR